VSGECVFCKIASGEIKSKIVYSDADVIAFEDISPAAPNHVLFIPKAHIGRIEELSFEDRRKITSKMFEAISKVVLENGLGASGYRVVINQGKEAGQLVPHLHFHVLAGRPLGWPPG
jgi:histidine triad (HIT) family protein